MYIFCLKSLIFIFYSFSTIQGGLFPLELLKHNLETKQKLETFENNNTNNRLTKREKLLTLEQ